jgi:hypothetical protein
MFIEGVKLLDAGNPRAALDEFETAAQKAPTEAAKADALYNVAVCHVRLGDSEAAMQAMSEALMADATLASDVIQDDDFAVLQSIPAFRRMLHFADPRGLSFLSTAKIEAQPSHEYDSILSRPESAGSGATVLPDYFPPPLRVRILRWVAATTGGAGVSAAISGVVEWSPDLVGSGILLAIVSVVPYVIAEGMNDGGPQDQISRDQEAKEIADLALSGEATGPYALYLRPFGSTGQLQKRQITLLSQEASLGGSPSKEFSFELESTIAQAIQSWIPMIALGRPGEHFGSGRLPVSDDEWRTVVRQLVGRANVVFVVPGQSEGMTFELKYLRNEGYLEKSVMVMPPGQEADSWAATTAALAALGYELPPHDTRGAMFRVAQDGRVEKLKRLPRRWTLRRFRKIVENFCT